MAELTGLKNGCVVEITETVEKTCPRCEQSYCESCCGGTYVHSRTRYSPEYMDCPSCGRDWAKYGPDYTDCPSCGRDWFMKGE